MTNRDLFQQYVSYVGDNFIIDPTTLQVGDTTISHRNVTLLTLAYALNDNALIVGEPGRAKTTVAKVLGSTLGHLPIVLYDQAMIRGHPDQTYHEMVGRPDFGAMNAGRERVIWQNTVMLPIAIIDEVNRLRPGAQDMILQAIESGSFSTLNECVLRDKMPFFATANHADDGNHKLISPLRDRFGISLEMGYVGALSGSQIENARENIAKLKERRITQKVMDALRLANGDMDKLEAVLLPLQKEYLAYLQNELDYASLPSTFLADVREEISKVALSGSDAHGANLEAQLLLLAIESECNMTDKYGIKRSSDSCGTSNHDSSLAATTMKNAVSGRAMHSLTQYSKALAWLRGDSQIRVDDVYAVAPYILGHRVDFTADSIAAQRELSRTVRFGTLGAPIEMMCADTLVRGIGSRIFVPETKDLCLAMLKIAQGADANLRAENYEAVHAVIREPQSIDHPLVREIATQYQKVLQQKVDAVLTEKKKN